MTQVTQEEMRTGLDNLEVKLMQYFSGLVGRIQTSKESEDVARHDVEALHQGNLEFRNVFFDQVSSIEDKFTKDLEEARRQLSAMTGDLAEVKSKQLTSTHVPETSASATQHLTRRKGV